jgi:hypothetical protein
VDAAERKNFDEDYARASWGAAVLRPYINVLRIEWRWADRKNGDEDYVRAIWGAAVLAPT